VSAGRDHGHGTLSTWGVMGRSSLAPTYLWCLQRESRVCHHPPLQLCLVDIISGCQEAIQLRRGHHEKWAECTVSREHLCLLARAKALAGMRVFAEDRNGPCFQDCAGCWSGTPSAAGLTVLTSVPVLFSAQVRLSCVEQSCSHVSRLLLHLKNVKLETGRARDLHP